MFCNDPFKVVFIDLKKAFDRDAEICKEVRPTQYGKNHVQKYSRTLSTILLHGMGMLH